MYKNQLQELAQRSCFNLPWYTCIREGPDHAPRFKATVNFNGEVFESPNFCTTLRQAEHSAAEVALNSLSNRAPTHSLAARILDETGVYKNLLQEVSQRVGAALPRYTTVRSGLGHLPVFTCTVDLAGIIFTGDPAKSKKQAEKNAAMAAWSSLKQLVQQDASSSSETDSNDEQEQVAIARATLNYRQMARANSPSALLRFPKKLPTQHQRPLGAHSLPSTSKILPLIHPESVSQSRSIATVPNDTPLPSRFPPLEMRSARVQMFPAVDATPYVPVRLMRAPYHGVAQPVTMKTAVPVFSAPPFPPPANRPSQMTPSATANIAPPVHIKEAVPVFSAPPTLKVEEGSLASTFTVKSADQMEATGNKPLVAAPQVSPEEPPVVTTPSPSKASTHNTGNKATDAIQELIVACENKISLEAKPSLHVKDVDNELEGAGQQGVK